MLLPMQQLAAHHSSAWRAQHCVGCRAGKWEGEMSFLCSLSGLKHRYWGVKEGKIKGPWKNVGQVQEAAFICCILRSGQG